MNSEQYMIPPAAELMHIDEPTATRDDTDRSADLRSAGHPKVGEIIAGRFRLVSRLGSGATGTVFAAIDASIGETVAVKMLHPHLRDQRTRERLRREVRASRPGHPNIVSVYDLHEAGRHLFLSMELVQGQSLRSVLDHDGELAVDRVVDIGRQSTAALDQLHRKGLVHRDVKPGNILVTSDDTVKVCDMGLARPLEEGVTVTETEMVVGTPGYMAPELASGLELTSASDIYGLGLTLYQTLTGEVPLKETTVIATLSRRQHGRPQSVRSHRPDCPRWLDRLILRMLEPDPKQRLTAPQALKAFQDRRLAPRPRRRTVFWTATVMAVALAGAWGVHVLRQRTTTMVDVAASSITGRDIHGRPTWRREFDLPVYTNETADLNGDGDDEIIVVLGTSNGVDAPFRASDGPEIWIFESNGDVVTRFEPEQETEWRFGYEVQVHCTPHVLDLDHDRRPEVLSVCQHVSFFPTVVFVYQMTTNRWDQVLTHPGYLLDVRPTPEDRGPGFRFIAVNNRLGVVEFMGEISIEGDTETALNGRTNSANPGLRAPPNQSTTFSPPFRWSAYIPLPARETRVLAVDSSIEDLDDGSVRLTTRDGGDLVYDRFWNATPGPNGGRDLRSLRWDFMARLNRFTPEFQMRTPESVSRLRSTMLTTYAALLEEPSYRLILDLKSGQALAQTGRIDQARALLRETYTRTGHSDAAYRLAHLDALVGDRERASETLGALMTNRGRAASGTRALFDGPHLAIRVGIENHDPALIRTAVSLLSAQGGSEEGARVAQTLQARVHLWWDRLHPEDLEVTSRSFSPAGDAVACLARWRAGLTKAGDVDRMNALVENNPDVEFEGKLARAAALLGVGESGRALDEIAVVTQQMEFPSRDDFAVRQLVNLAQAMRVVALRADGQVDRARTDAARLQATLTPGLLPAILVEEVLAG